MNNEEKKELEKIIDNQLKVVKEELLKREQYVISIISGDTNGKQQLISYDTNGIIRLVSEKYSMISAYGKGFFSNAMRAIGEFYSTSAYNEAKKKRDEKDKEAELEKKKIKENKKSFLEKLFSGGGDRDVRPSPW